MLFSNMSREVRSRYLVFYKPTFWSTLKLLFENQKNIFCHFRPTVIFFAGWPAPRVAFHDTKESRPLGSWHHIDRELPHVMSRVRRRLAVEWRGANQPGRRHPRKPMDRY